MTLKKQRGEEAKQKAKEIAKLVKQRTEDLQEVCGLESGIRFLKMIFDKCGYNKTNVPLNSRTGTIDRPGMEYNEGRRAIWLEIRGYLSKNLKSKIEL